MKPGNNISGLIIEGIPGSGKTSILKTITNDKGFLAKTDGSYIILNEFQTQRVLEQKDKDGILTKKDNIELLQSHLNYLSDLNTRLVEAEWCRKNQAGHTIHVIFERFHLTHLFYYSHIIWEDIASFDEILRNLNFKLCALTAGREALADRLFEQRKEDNQWNNFIKRFGNSTEKIVDFFIRQQESLMQGYENSVLPKIIIDTSNKEIFQTTDEVLDFWLTN